MVISSSFRQRNFFLSFPRPTLQVRKHDNARVVIKSTCRQLVHDNNTSSIRCVEIRFHHRCLGTHSFVLNFVVLSVNISPEKITYDQPPPPLTAHFTTCPKNVDCIPIAAIIHNFIIPSPFPVPTKCIVIIIIQYYIIVLPDTTTSWTYFQHKTKQTELSIPHIELFPSYNISSMQHIYIFLSLFKIRNK